MKQGKRPTLRQKRLLAKHRLNPQDWYICKAVPNELHIVHRHSDTTTRIVKLPTG